ncbi:phage regulatory CII family protein [Photobacterium sp. 53610]|uniref:phage regulatory CII family protein n=1 Tax=Photobacterium sp. 53610 TaxID=3102789 RepID=UPI002ED90DFC
MDANSSTFVFREAEQKAFDEACCSFAKQENMTQIATQVGINPVVLRNKLNPGNERHKLTAVELVKISRASGNYCIANSLLFSLGMVGAKVTTEGEKQNLTHRALENSMHAGELSRMALEAGGHIRLPRSKRNALLERAHDSVRNLVLLISDIENRSAGLQPLVSASVDFVTSGMPLPGLA